MSDSISRQAAIKYVCTMLKNCFNATDEMIESVKITVGELPPTQQWIPCTPDTMPKMSAMTETYLVKVGINECGEGMHTEVRTADWYSRSKMWNVHESEKSIVGEVTEWMPIPLEGGQDE